MKKFYVGIAGIIEKEDKYLILRRSNEKDFLPNTLEMVTGRLEENEPPELGLLREVKEETSLDVSIIMPVHTGFFYRGGKEFPMVFIMYWCLYKKGQVKLSWEHSEFVWMAIDEILAEKELEKFHDMFKKVSRLKKHLPEDFLL